MLSCFLQLGLLSGKSSCLGVTSSKVYERLDYVVLEEVSFLCGGKFCQIHIISFSGYSTTIISNAIAS